MDALKLAKSIKVIPQENLAKWHKDSHPATKNSDGTPKVFYTGTSKDVPFEHKKAGFKTDRHGAWFTTDPKDASSYAIQNDSQGYKKDGWKIERTNTASRVIPAHIRALNPYTGPRPNYQGENYKKFQSDWFDELRAKGHDAWIPEDAGGNLAVVLGHGSQIKSATGNSGDYSLSSTDIGKAKGGFAEAQQDPTSVLHGLPEIEMPDSLQELQDWRGQHKYHPKNGAAYNPDQMLGRGFGPQGVLVHQHRTGTPEYADGGNVEGDVDTSYWGNLWRGLQSIPETAYNYLKNTSYGQMGSDAVDLGKNVYHDITEHPMENLLGALPVVGSGMAAYEAYKLNDRIKQAYASGNHEDAKKLERALVLSSLGAVPIFGELSSAGAGAARMAEEAALHGAAETGSRAITNALPKDAYQVAQHMVANKADQAVDAAKKRMFADVSEDQFAKGGVVGLARSVRPVARTKKK